MTIEYVLLKQDDHGVSVVFQHDAPMWLRTKFLVPSHDPIHMMHYLLNMLQMNVIVETNPSD